MNVSGKKSQPALDAIVVELSNVDTIWGQLAGEEMAKIALRLWRTYRRRHPQAHQIEFDDRVQDLAKGIRAHFEPPGSIQYIFAGDWIVVARQLGDVLARAPL
jgi:hypothetical protein